MARVLKVDTAYPRKEVITEAARVIKEGGLVIFPTETVYGLGADAFNEEAVKRIFVVKGRPGDKPLSILIAERGELKKYVSEIPRVAEDLMEKFWPGPLTLVFKASSLIPGIIRGEGDTIGIRMPDCQVALALIRDSRVPLACPSANLSGCPGPTKVSRISRELKEKIDLILDGGGTRMRIESTVLDLSTFPPVILREGFLKKREIGESVRELL